MRYLKTFEDISLGKEKYMIFTKDEKFVVSYINNYSKKTNLKMSALFTPTDTIDPTEPKMLFDSLDDAKRALDGISKSNFYRVFNVSGDNDSLVDTFIVPDEKGMYNKGHNKVTREEFNAFMSNLKIEKMFIGLFSGDLNI